MPSAAPVLLVRSPFVNLPEDRLAAWCAQFGVTKLAVFGSAKNGPFRDDSDVDLLFHAPRGAAVYQADGRPSRAAVEALREACGVQIDLVCARALVATRNPFVIHNVFVEQRFDRATGMLWYLRAAAGELEAVRDPAATLADPRTRMRVLLPLLRLGRAAYRPELVARWRELGLGEVPWARIRELLEPTLACHKEQRPVVWPSDEALLAFIDALRPHLPQIRITAHRTIAPIEPRIPMRLIVEASGDEWARFPAARNGRFARCEGATPPSARGASAGDVATVGATIRPTAPCPPLATKR